MQSRSAARCSEPTLGVSRKPSRCGSSPTQCKIVATASSIRWTTWGATDVIAKEGLSRPGEHVATICRRGDAQPSKTTRKQHPGH